METKNHYDNHLSDYYSWIYGGHAESIEKNKKFFESHKVMPFGARVAIDLGAGPGFQSIPLSQAGYNVVAVDFCRSLLNEIDQQKYNIEIIEDDILNFARYSGKSPELIICMGDTLTHLPDIASVVKLIENSYEELILNGKIILSFRDLTFELKGPDRFIPVRSEFNKIFTCFLEYGTDDVIVYDIVNERSGEQWTQKISCYRKIKISEEKIRDIMVRAGFEIDFFDKENGVMTVGGIKRH